MLVICAVKKVNLYYWPHKTIITCVPYGFIMRRKYFAGNFSPCIILLLTMNIYRDADNMLGDIRIMLE